MSNQDRSEFGGSGSMKISDCVKKNKRVILLIQNTLLTKFTGNSKVYRQDKNKGPEIMFNTFESAGWIEKTSIFDSYWANTGLHELMHTKQIGSRTYAEYRGRFFANQITLTPGKDLCKAIMGCGGQRSLRVDKITSAIHKNNFFGKKLKESCTDPSKGFPWNILVFDFIEKMPYLCKFILGMNYSNVQLVITAAALQNKLNTSQINKVKNEEKNNSGDDNVQKLLIEKLNTHIVKGNTLFIIDFKEDMGLDYKKGQMAIAFEFRKKLTAEEISKKTNTTKTADNENAPLIANDKSTEVLFKGISCFKFEKNTKFLLNVLTAESHGCFWRYDEGQNAQGETEMKMVTVEAGIIQNGSMIKNTTHENLKSKVLKSDNVMSYNIDEQGKVQFVPLI